LSFNWGIIMDKKHRLCITLIKNYIFYIPLIYIGTYVISDIISILKGRLIGVLQGESLKILVYVSIFMMFYITFRVIFCKRYDFLCEIKYKDEEEKQNKLKVIDIMIRDKTSYIKKEEKDNYKIYQTNSKRIIKCVSNEIKIIINNESIEVFGPLEYKCYLKCLQNFL